MIHLVKIVCASVALTSALSVDSRGAGVIQASLNAVDHDTTSFAQYIQSFHPGPVGLPPPNYAQILENDLANCTAVGRESGPLSPPQTRSICEFVSGRLYNDTKSLLNAFVAKKNVFVSAGLRGAVTDDLQILQSDTASCLASIRAKGATPSTVGGKTLCSSAAYGFNSIYASAISAFGSS